METWRAKENGASKNYMDTGETGRGRVPPRCLTGKFCWLTGKREARKRKKGKIQQKRRKIEKVMVENWKWNEEKLQNEERTPFFLNIYFNFFFKPLKFVLGLPNENFLPGKSISRQEKNHDKWLCPLCKIFLLHPCTWIRKVEKQRKELGWTSWKEDKQVIGNRGSWEESNATDLGWPSL